LPELDGPTDVENAEWTLDSVEERPEKGKSPTSHSRGKRVRAAVVRE
jgi:hypothetical protein